MRSQEHVPRWRGPSYRSLWFNGVKVFSATMFADRERLGDSVTTWLASRPDLKVTQMVVTQSSDASFHCIAITVFYWEPIARA